MTLEGRQGGDAAKGTRWASGTRPRVEPARLRRGGRDALRRPFDIATRLAELTRDPADSSQFTMRIDAEGVWHYQGSRIPRPALVKLFATALHRAPDGSYWLATPVEAGRVEVADVPFTIVEVAVDRPGPDQLIRLRTNLDAWVPLDARHPLTMRASAADGAAAVPYVVVRPAEPGRLALEARLLRPVFYHLVDIAEPDQSGTHLFVRSAGRRFDLGWIGS